MRGHSETKSETNVGSHLKRKGGVLQEMEQRQVGAEDRRRILVHHCVE